MDTSDLYMDELVCYQRLYKEYKEHKSLIVAVDFDNTIYDYHGIGLTFPLVVSLLKKCNVLNFKVVIFTANQNYEFINAYCKKIGVDIYGINENVISDFAFPGGKIYYNILLDDRAGLGEAVCTLNRLIQKIEE